MRSCSICCRKTQRTAFKEAIETSRAEAKRLAKEEWEREDPEFEAKRKIEQMRLRNSVK